MGEKKIKKNEGGEKKNNGEVVEKKEGEGKKNDGNLTVVLKSDCPCDCCVIEVVKAIRSVGGVEKVTCYTNSKYLTVIGKVDPVTLREKVQQKTHKYIELISPVPKKDGKAKGGDAGAGDEKKKQNKEKDSKENKGGGEHKRIIHIETSKPAQKKDGGENKKEGKEKELKNLLKQFEGTSMLPSNEIVENKSKPPITTTVLKVHLHRQGCIQKIQEIVTKFKGYKEMKVDKHKNLVTITGSMDVKELAKTLKKHFKNEVKIVPPKKEGGDNKKEKGGDDKKK